MADGSVKTVAIKGDAAKHYHEFFGGKKKRATAKRQKGGAADGQGQPLSNIPPGPHLTQKGGNINFTRIPGESPNTPGQLPLTQSMPGTNPQNPPTNTPAHQAAAAAGTLPNVLPTQNLPGTSLPGVQNGGAKSGLVLAPKKKPAGRLHLAPPKGRSGHASSTHRASTRKIKVNLTNMKKRIHTAKLIHKDSKEKSIDEIRQLLEAAKLIKPAKEGKKVPEDILRNIYKDYLILRNKAL